MRQLAVWNLLSDQGFETTCFEMYECEDCDRQYITITNCMTQIIQVYKKIDTSLAKDKNQ